MRRAPDALCTDSPCAPHQPYCSAGATASSRPVIDSSFASSSAARLLTSRSSNLLRRCHAEKSDTRPAVIALVWVQQ